jgi:hypothetical protein
VGAWTREAGGRVRVKRGCFCDGMHLERDGGLCTSSERSGACIGQDLDLANGESFHPVPVITRPTGPGWRAGACSVQRYDVHSVLPYCMARIHTHETTHQGPANSL